MMEFRNLINDNTCNSFSQKLKDRMGKLTNVGEITTKMAETLGGTLIITNLKNEDNSAHITLYLVVNDNDAIMASKFQSFGSIETIVSADVLAGLILGKTLHKAIRITAEDIESVLRDDIETPALPDNKIDSLDLAIQTLREAAAQHKGSDILEELKKELKAKEDAKPKPLKSRELLDIDEDLSFADMSAEQMLQTVEVTLDEHIREMLIMDGGNMEVIDIKKEESGITIFIKYLGNCSGCATGDTGTLYAIESTLKKHIDPNITVIPI